MYLNGVICTLTRDPYVHFSAVSSSFPSEQVSTPAVDTFMSAFYVFYNPSSLLTPVYAFNVLQNSKLFV